MSGDPKIKARASADLVTKGRTCHPTTSLLIISPPKLNFSPTPNTPSTTPRFCQGVGTGMLRSTTPKLLRLLPSIPLQSVHVPFLPPPPHSNLPKYLLHPFRNPRS